jgi:hypothetical protein
MKITDLDNTIIIKGDKLVIHQMVNAAYHHFKMLEEKEGKLPETEKRTYQKIRSILALV